MFWFVFGNTNQTSGSIIYPSPAIGAQEVVDSAGQCLVANGLEYGLMLELL